MEVMVDPNLDVNNPSFKAEMRAEMEKKWEFDWEKL